MAFQKAEKEIQFSDLKGVLSQSKAIDPALYQTIQILIERLDEFKIGHDSTINNINNSVNTIFSSTVVTPNVTATYLTLLNEVAKLPFSVELIAGANIILDRSVINKLTISATAGGGTGGGMNLDYFGNYVSGTYNDGDIVVGSDGIAYMCVKDGTATPPETWPGGSGTGGGGTSGPHAPTHELGGTDVVDVKLLGGFPGGLTTFLRADATFAVPAPASHHFTHEPGGTDAMAIDAIAATGSLRTLGTGSQQAAAGNDTRFTNARPPTTHAPTHSLGGSDPVTITNLAGFPGGVVNFLRADGTFSPVPPGDVIGPSSSLALEIAVFSNTTGKLIQGGGKLISGLASSTHAPTHSSAGADPVTITNLAGYPGGTVNFLRADGTFATPPGGTHAPTHSAAGSDPVNILNLGGYIGDVVKFLRSDGLFVAPPGTAGIPGLHHATHEPGGGDLIANNAWTNLTNTFTAAQRIIMARPYLEWQNPGDTSFGRIGKNSTLARLDISANLKFDGTNLNSDDTTRASTQYSQFDGYHSFFTLPAGANPRTPAIVNILTLAPDSLATFTGNILVNKSLPEVQVLSSGTTVKTRMLASGTVTQGIFSNNLDYNGTNWVRDDITLAGCLMSMNNGITSFYYTPAGANPATLTQSLLIDQSGAVTITNAGGNVALKTINNNFVAQTLATGTTISGNSSQFYLLDTGSPVDSKLWRLWNPNDGYLHIQALNDANTVVIAEPLALGRTGITYITATELIQTSLGSPGFLRHHFRDTSQSAGLQTFVILAYQQALYIAPAADNGLNWATTVPNWNGALSIFRNGNVQIGARLQVGGTSSAFPAWRNTGANMECVLADQSNWANLFAANFYAQYVGTSFADLTVRGATDFMNGVSTSGATNIVSSGGIYSVKNIYPGRVDVGAGGAQQTSWYLGSHASYGLWSNTGFYAAYNIVTAADIFEKNRGTAMGHWIDVPWNASNYGTNSAGSITIAALAPFVHRYCLIGKTMLFHAAARITAQNGTTTEFRFTIPGGYTAKPYDYSTVGGAAENQAGMPAHYAAISSGVSALAMVFVNAAGNYVSFQRGDGVLGAGFSSGDTYAVQFMISIALA